MRYPSRLATFVGAVCLLAGVGRAEATTITFENEPLGPFTAPTNDSGYTLTPLTGSLTIANNGNPNHDLEAALGTPPALPATVLNNQLQITRTVASTFQLTAFDLGLRADGTVDFNGTIVDAYRNGILVGTETFENLSLNGGYNWTTQNSATVPNALTGSVFNTDIDRLVFTLPAFYAIMNNPAAAAIDNVVLTQSTTPIPEPSAIALLLPGLLAAGMVRRRS
jgi:hypothetical protein